jgi:hypothetical protein
MEYYHRIEAPVIEDGEVVMEVKDTKRGPIEVPKMDWIASAFCLGETGTPENPGPLMLEGIDPANCPACESAANNTGVKAPEQRYAAPVIKYKVKGRGKNPYELIVPTTAEILVWAYTGRQHGMLFDLAAREEMDLRKLDITIDLEDTPGADTFQKIKALGVIRTPAWKDPKVREYLRQLWSDPENRPTDEQLRVACKGRDYARPVLLDMVRRAERQWRDSERGGGSGGDLGAADAGFNGSLDEGIDSLLGQGETVPGSNLAEGLDQAGLLSADEKNDIFADIEASKAGPTAGGATTTGTAAPAAESPSRTEPKSAPPAGGSEEPQDEAREKAVDAAADDLFGESPGGSAPPEPASSGRAVNPTATARRQGGASGSRSRGSGAGSAAASEPPASEEPSLDAPEPASVPAGGGGDVIDFDDLFKD